MNHLYANIDLCVSNLSSVVDLLENKGVSWGAYLESMPYTGFTAESTNLYYRKHNPLVTPQSFAL
jgi:acid phosphatase